MEKEKIKMNTVLENDIDKILNTFNLKDDFYNKKIKCKFCKEIITMDNIYSFLPESGSINLICDKESCISELLIYIENKKRKIASE